MISLTKQYFLKKEILTLLTTIANCLRYQKTKYIALMENRITYSEPFTQIPLLFTQIPHICNANVFIFLFIFIFLHISTYIYIHIYIIHYTSHYHLPLEGNFSLHSPLFNYVHKPISLEYYLGRTNTQPIYLIRLVNKYYNSIASMK